jgi:hypothetical protein
LPAPAERVIEIVLAAAHLDHGRQNGAWDNLVAYCQRYDTRYDHDHDHDHDQRSAAAGRVASPDEDSAAL